MTGKLPEDLGDVLRDVIRRLEVLESSSRLARSSIRDGALEIQRSDGTIIGRLGKQTDGSFGVTHVHENGNLLYQHSSMTGQAFPGAQLAMELARGPVSFTGAAFEIAAETVADTALSTAVLVAVGWATGAGTTGQLRLRNLNSGAVSTVRPLGGGTSGVAEFRWLHQQPVGSGPLGLAVDVRRTGGADVVWIWPITQGYQIEGVRIGATTDG